VTGTPLVISLANGQSIIIPVNASSGSVDFIAPNTNPSLTNSITGVTGGYYEHLETAGTPTTVVSSNLLNLGTDHLPLMAINGPPDGSDITDELRHTTSVGTPEPVNNGEYVIDTASDVSPSQVVMASMLSGSGMSLIAEPDLLETGNQTAMLDNAAFHDGQPQSSITTPVKGVIAGFGDANFISNERKTLNFHDLLQDDDEDQLYELLPISESTSHSAPTTTKDDTIASGFELQSMLEEIHRLNDALLLHLM
jgi:hypothetical protein